MLKFRGYSRFIWDLIQRLATEHTHECECFGTSSVQHSNTRTWSQHSDLKFAQKGILDPHAKWRNKTNFCTQSNTEARRLYRLFLRRSESLHHNSTLFSSPNVPSNTHFLLQKHAQWSLIRTDTQRGVVSGLSQNRNLRSKIWWFTEFCNSHYVSHFAAFFIVTGAKISIVNSCFLFTLYSYSSARTLDVEISQSSLVFLFLCRSKKKM